MMRDLGFSVLLVLGAWAGTAMAQPAPASEAAPPSGPTFQWQSGPLQAKLGSVATIDVPAGFDFLDGPESRKLLEAMENPTNGSELGLIANRDAEWFVVFDFSDVGYVSDEDKDDLDADALLKSLKEGNAEANRVRQSRGWAPAELIGWHTKPAYNPQTNNLEWATLLKSGADETTNFNTRLLGRRGFMSVALVESPKKLDGTLPAYRSLMNTFKFTNGESYAEYTKGDRVAEYGLGALVTGGAVAAAVKFGFFKKFWKLIVAGIAAIGASIGKLFKRKQA